MNSTAAYCCSCIGALEIKESFKEELEKVDYVMELEIVKVLVEPKYGFIGTQIVQARVTKVHKGELLNETIEIFAEPDGGGNCEYHFQIGESYLFYGYQIKDDKYFHTTICNRTGRLSERAFDLKLLKVFTMI